MIPEVLWLQCMHARTCACMHTHTPVKLGLMEQQLGIGVERNSKQEAGFILNSPSHCHLQTGIHFPQLSPASKVR